MRFISCALLVGLALASGCAAVRPTEAEARAESEALAAFLQRLTGEFTYDSEAMIAPDEPWAQGTGEQSGRILGQWLVIDGRDTTSAQHPMTNMLRIGYDAHERRIVASWIDSVQTMRWSYTGTLSGDGTELTLEADGPNPAEPGKTLRYRHVITATDGDSHRGASAVRKDREWIEFARYSYTREPAAAKKQ